MVLAEKIGTKRSFVAGLIFTIVTLGVYAVYWNYRAHNEVYRQFELARERRDEGMVWYVLGLVLFPFLLAYLWVFSSNVSYVRERVGLRPGLTPGRLVALVALALGLFVGGILTLEFSIESTGPEGETTSQDVDRAVTRVGLLVLGLVLAAITLLGVVYARLQRDINETWDAFDARIAYLLAHPEEIHRERMAEIPRASGAASLASPARREVEALRARYPTLRALPELDADLARAEAGDAEARERAETLLADVAALLQERATLIHDIRARDAETAAIRERLEQGALAESDLARPLADLEPRDARERLALVNQALFQ